MKINHSIQHPTSWKAFLGLLIATCAFAAAAYAQPTFAGRFTLPYEVHWGQAVLPAGDYSIRMGSAGPAVISAKNGTMSVFTQPPIMADSEKGGTSLTITRQGNERTVRSLNLPQLGKLVVFAPLTKAEREISAKAGHVDTVPVVTAQK
jgi:hypothetical protein